MDGQRDTVVEQMFSDLKKVRGKRYIKQKNHENFVYTIMSFLAWPNDLQNRCSLIRENKP